MFWTPITEQESQKLIDFIEKNDSSVLETDIPQRFLGLASAYQKKLVETVRELRKENAKLARKIKTQEYEKEQAVLAEDFKDLGFDSVDIALAIMYFVNQRCVKISKMMLMCIFYEAYTTWLADHGERICLEHPVALESGPWFWRAHKKIPNVNVSVDKALVDRIYECNKGVVVFLRNVVNRYYDRRESDLIGFFKRSRPYKNASAKNNGGKWSNEIKDSDIYHWKKDLKGE